MNSNLIKEKQLMTNFHYLRTMFVVFSLFVMPLLMGFLFAANNVEVNTHNDLELEKLDSSGNKYKEELGLKSILFADRLYLVEGENENIQAFLDLHNIPYLDQQEFGGNYLDIFKEYENFLKVIFNNSSTSAIMANLNSLKNSNSYSPNTTNQRKKRRKAYSVSILIETVMPAGTAIPFLEGIKGRFGNGIIAGIHLTTPFSYKFGKYKTKIGCEINYSILPANNDDGWNYSLVNFFGNLSFFTSPSIEIKAGLGLTAGSVGDQSKLMISIPLDINYYLPIKSRKYKVALNLRAQETLGLPGSDEGTTDLIQLGIILKTPFSLYAK